MDPPMHIYTLFSLLNLKFFLFFLFLRTQTVMAAMAEAEKIKLIGAAEATAIEAVGNAEAEEMVLKSGAYKQYGKAAMLNLMLETLPKVKKKNLFFSSPY